MAPASGERPRRDSVPSSTRSLVSRGPGPTSGLARALPDPTAIRARKRASPRAGARLSATPCGSHQQRGRSADFSLIFVLLCPLAERTSHVPYRDRESDRRAVPLSIFCEISRIDGYVPYNRSHEDGSRARRRSTGGGTARPSPWLPHAPLTGRACDLERWAHNPRRARTRGSTTSSRLRWTVGRSVGRTAGVWKSVV